jgi:O-6-methylguanine DNA methyltransferase
LIGDASGIKCSAFARYGQPIAIPRVQEAAEMLDLLDEQGHLIEEEKMSDQVGERGWLGTDQLPDPVVDAAMQTVAYFHGKRANMNIRIQFEQGSPFQQRVWNTLQQIPFGVTWTYEDLASVLCDQDRVQARKMARAVGAACGANPLPLILPCHRVIGKNGHLVGFSGGLDIKEYLLGLELLGLNEWKATSSDE